LERERPLPEYAALTAAFGAALGGFLLLARRKLPERVGLVDVVGTGLASYKVGRLVAKDDVTTWVRAPVTEDPDATQPKRQGVERALGELLTCPYCVGVWVASGLSYGLVLFPRQTRLVNAIFGAQAVADFLNAGFVRLRDE
jgi:hypothetical protein